MPVIEISINGRSAISMGGTDYSHLTFGVIRAHSLSRPSLKLMGRKQNDTSNVEWDVPNIVSGDVISVVCRSDRFDTKVPPDADLISPSTFKEAERTTEPFNKSNRCRMVCRGVATLTATVYGEATLQSTIEINGQDKCPVLTFGCLHDNQPHLDEMWLESQLPFDERVEFIVDFD